MVRFNNTFVLHLFQVTWSNDFIFSDLEFILQYFTAVPWLSWPDEGESVHRSQMEVKQL
jgi:hypothetical protein